LIKKNKTFGYKNYKRRKEITRLFQRKKTAGKPGSEAEQSIRANRSCEEEELIYLE
jgi:hypothetical protein